MEIKMQTTRKELQLTHKYITNQTLKNTDTLTLLNGRLFWLFCCSIRSAAEAGGDEALMVRATARVSSSHGWRPCLRRYSSVER